MTDDMKEVRWYEVWADYVSRPPYLLFLWEDMEGNFEVYNPLEKKYAFSTTNYEDAKLYCLEDEFTLVDGRMFDDPLTEVPSS